MCAENVKSIWISSRYEENKLNKTFVFNCEKNKITLVHKIITREKMKISQNNYKYLKKRCLFLYETTNIFFFFFKEDIC